MTTAQVTNPARQSTDVAEFLRLLQPEGGVFEIRAPKTSERSDGQYASTYSGYFNDPELAADAIKNSIPDLAPAIYVTMNPVASDLLARAENCIKAKARATTQDANILKRRWLFFDIDPKRPAEISSTEAEKSDAMGLAKSLREYLAGEGWPEPLRGMSGNGVYLIYRIDLPVDDDGLCQSVLESLAGRFDSDKAEIDTTVHNPSRIVKVLGTIARKGTDFQGNGQAEARPHRRSWFFPPEQSLTPVSVEQLRRVVSANLTTKTTSKPSSAPRRVSGFDQFEHTADGVEGYLVKHGVEVRSRKPVSNGTILFLNRCPVHPDIEDHEGSSIGVLVDDNEKISYVNYHNRAGGKGGTHWIDIRDALEPGYKAFSEQQRAKHMNKRTTEDSPLVTAKIGGVVDVPAPALTFDIERTPGRARAKITVLVDDNPIAVESLNIADSAKRDAFAQMIHGRAPQFDLDVIQGKLLQAAAARPPAAPSDDEDQIPRDELLGQRDEQNERVLAAMPHEVVTDAMAMLADDQLIERVLTDIEVLGVVGERDLALAVYLIGTSRLLDRPLSAITQGTTSSGKSFVNKQIAQLFPPEVKLIATSITSQALYYLRPGSLIHTFVVAGERSRVQNDERAEATRALREMQADRELTKVVTTTIGGCPETKVVHMDGPISFCETTTLCRIFDEDANRALLLSTNEGKEQTALVKQALAHNARYGAADTDRTIARHLALQRLLKRVRVTIPFAETLNESIPSDRTEARRATSHVLEMVKVVALLHQRQRTAGKVEHGTVIEATVADYEIARTILLGPISRALGRALPPAATSLFERLQQRYGDETFTSSEAARDDSIITGRNKMSEHLRTIADSTGAIEIVEQGRGNKPHVWKLVGELPDRADAWLPYAVEMDEMGGQAGK